MNIRNRFDSYDFILPTKTARDGWRRWEEEGRRGHKEKKSHVTGNSRYISGSHEMPMAGARETRHEPHPDIL